MAISFPLIPQFQVPTTQPTTRPTSGLTPTAGEPQDSVTLGNWVDDFPQFPKPGAFGAVAAAAEKPKSMAELDQQAADCIDQGTQAILNLREKPATPPAAKGQFTNFSHSTFDFQSAASDQIAAQAIQRQTQLALRDKKAPDNKLTRAAVERRQAALKEKLSSVSGTPSPMAMQAFEQQKQIVAISEKAGWPDSKQAKPTTQPQPGFPPGFPGGF